MQLRLLGPLEAAHGSIPVDLGAGKQRALVAVLLLNANRAVSRATLIDALWGEQPPETAPKMVQVYVSRLRKVLPEGALVTRGNGYELVAAAGDVDLLEFQRLAAEGREALARGDAAAASAVLGDALALWRGTPLAEFDEPFARVERPRLEELRLAAHEDRIEADLALGRDAQLTGELDALVARHPLRERLRAQQMRALAGSGRQAEALQAYRDARRALLDELGIQPSRMLRELEERILRQEERAGSPTAPAPTPPRTAPRPVAAPGSAPPVTRYATSDGASIAYQVAGEGDHDVLMITGWVLPMELFWDDPDYVRFIGRFTRAGRVILSDKRGTGLSDRVASDRLPTLEERTEDLVAVLDAAGSERAAVFGISEGGPMGALLAATHPDRVSSLALCGAFARSRMSPDYPYGYDDRQWAEFNAWVTGTWGEAADLLDRWAPSCRSDERLRTWWSRALRLGASPGSALAWLLMAGMIDVRAALPAITAPTLVVHRRGDRIVPVEHGRYLAEHIEG